MIGHSVNRDTRPILPIVRSLPAGDLPHYRSAMRVQRIAAALRASARMSFINSSLTSGTAGLSAVTPHSSATSACPPAARRWTTPASSPCATASANSIDNSSWRLLGAGAACCSACATSDGSALVRRVATERPSVSAGTAIRSAGKRAETASSASPYSRFRSDFPDRSLARRPLSGVEWPCPRRATNPGVLRRPRCTRSCTIISRRFARKPPACGMEKDCPDSSRRSSGGFCGAAGSPAGSRGFAATIAASTG